MLRKNDFFHHRVIVILSHRQFRTPPLQQGQHRLYRIFNAIRYFPK